MSVLILGAGPCGLTAAWEFLRRGVHATVVEKDSAVGGLCKTIKRGGYQFDLGGHRFISADRRLVEDVKALMGDRLLVRDRKSVIRFADREYCYPINIGDVLSKSGPWMSARFAAGYLASATGLYHSPAPEESFEAWIDRRFGRPLNELFFKPYTEKLWGIPASRLSADWAGRRISLLNAKDAVLKALKISGKRPRTYAAKYLYPRGGIGEIFEIMAGEIERLGGRVVTCAEAVSLKTRDGRIEEVVIRHKDGAMEPFGARNVLSTIPLDRLASMIDPGAPALPWRALRFLNVTLSGVEDLSPNTWMYTPEPDVIMTRVQEPKRRSPESAPPGRTSVMLEIPCQAGDKTWSMPDEALLDIALKDLKKLGLDMAWHVTGFFSTYAENAYPRYELGYKERVESLLGAVRRMKNLDTLGRQGFFRYIFMDEAMTMGRRLARRALGEEEETDEPGGGEGVIEAGSVAV
ncbi:MAG: FAD-dependent oxidoreductase [Candidatus Nitrospinota bacterium M3_3B_026]